MDEKKYYVKSKYTNGQGEDRHTKQAPSYISFGSLYNFIINGNNYLLFVYIYI